MAGCARQNGATGTGRIAERRARAPSGVSAAVITPIREEIPLTLPINRTLKQKVLGKDWNWGEETESLQYIDDRAALLRLVEQQNGRRIWQRPP